MQIASPDYASPSTRQEQVWLYDDEIHGRKICGCG